MLDMGTMRAALVTVILLAASSTAARAGGYLGLGIGTAPAIHADGDRLVEDGRSARFVAGTRWGNFGVEGAVGGYGVLNANSPSPGLNVLGDLYQLSVALREILPLGGGFEAFGKGGVHHTWIDADNERV